MNKACYLILLLFSCKLCKGQNLVPNPGFEVYDTCPDNLFQVHRAVGWFGANGTPDYFNSCFIYSGTGWNVSVPSNWNGYQQASDGNGYIGMATFIKPDSTFISIREAIGIQLTTPLIAGTKYYASFYASLVNNSVTYNGSASNKLGLMFSNSLYLTNLSSNTIPYHNLSQVFTDSIITDTLNWVKISGSFIADSNYSYLYVGNFFQDSMVNFIPYSTTNDWSHYYIDEVCVSTDSLYCNPPLAINIIKKQDATLFFPNPFFDKLNITIKGKEAINLTLFDITSRKIFNKSFINSTTINTQDFAKGIYIYEVRNKSGVISMGKIVKE